MASAALVEQDREDLTMTIPGRASHTGRSKLIYDEDAIAEVTAEHGRFVAQDLAFQKVEHLAPFGGSLGDV